MTMNVSTVSMHTTPSAANATRDGYSIRVHAGRSRHTPEIDSPPTAPEDTGLMVSQDVVDAVEELGDELRLDHSSLIMDMMRIYVEALR